MASSVTIAVKGMTCSSCTQTVQQALISIPDVIAAVDLQGQRADVVLAPGTSVTTSDLVDRVVACGFEAEVLEDATKVIGGHFFLTLCSALCVIS
jgi:cation transport ATPase